MNEKLIVFFVSFRGSDQPPIAVQVEVIDRVGQVSEVPGRYAT